MSARSRTKGNAAEARVAAWLRDHGWPDCRSTRNAQGGGGTATSDITATDLPWSIEVKDVAAPRLAAWWDQATRQAHIERRVPLLVWHPAGKNYDILEAGFLGLLAQAFFLWAAANEQHANIGLLFNDGRESFQKQVETFVGVKRADKADYRLAG